MPAPSSEPAPDAPDDTPFDEAYLSAAAALAELPIPDERRAALVAAGAPIHSMFRTSLTSVDLGEAPPATAYAAEWE